MKFGLEMTLEKKLNQYLALYPNENEKINRMIHLLKTDSNCFENNNWNGHFTGSAWVIDKTHQWVLMTHHRKLNLWLQLGGHADGNTNLLDVAINEIKEESGLTQLNIVSHRIFDLDIHEIPSYNNMPKHYHYDIRFLLEVERDKEKIIVSHESYDVAWVHKSSVVQKNDEISIKRMLEKPWR